MPPSVRVVTASTQTVTPQRQLAGIVAPLQNVALTSALQEPADAVYVNEGDRVRRGQMLAHLNTADLSAQLAQAKAHVEQARYQAGMALSQGGDQVRSARASLELARADLARDQQLFAQGFISVQQVDTQRATVTQAQAALNQAVANAQANGTPDRGLQQADVDQAAAAADQIAAQIARASIVSPIDGVVVNRNINPGEYPGARQIFTLQEVSRVYAELNAYGAQVAGIRAGSPVMLSASALPGRSFAGSVDAVLSPSSPSSSGFVIKVIVPNGDGALRPGMTMSARVQMPSVRGIAIPVGAFMDDTHQTVLAIDQEGTAHVTRVTEIVENATLAVVTGLPAGSRVVANGQSNVSDGQKVVATL